MYGLWGLGAGIRGRGEFVIGAIARDPRSAYIALPVASGFPPVGTRELVFSARVDGMRGGGVEG